MPLTESDTRGELIDASIHARGWAEDRVSSRQRWSAPRKGVSLAAATTLRGKPVRDAVAVLTSAFRRHHLTEVFSTVFSPRLQRVAITSDVDSTSSRAAWNLVGIWLVARSSDGLVGRLGIPEAELWFRGETQLPAPLLSELISRESLWEVQQLLGKINLDAEFWDLLPYLLEHHGPGSRASVMKDPTTAVARTAKRESGVFYTPSDVADYMVEHIRQIYAGNFFEARCLDPACGTGVFLLAMLRAAVRHAVSRAFHRFDYVTSCLHGLDISSQALDSAAFVLLKECLSEVLTRGMSPWSAWHLIRLNLVDLDALCIDVVRVDSSSKSTNESAIRQAICEMLLRTPSQFVPPKVFGNSSLIEDIDFGPDLFTRQPLLRLADIFSNPEGSFAIVVGNPPYARLGKRSDYDLLAKRFACLRDATPGPRVNLFPLFVEMMWQFTRPRLSAAAFVTPLSIAFHSGTQYKRCRNAITCNGGRWEFAFFDRQPHALFGEEVKTRNTILFRSESRDTPQRGQPAEIETGPMRKWTSRTRKNLFEKIDFTPVDSINITNGIPKISGIAQARAFMVLRRREERFVSCCLSIGMCDPTEPFVQVNTPRVFVGGTAYNFLNVYRPIELSKEEREFPLSHSAVHCLEFKSEFEAQAAFAILSSRLVFWLWHVLGDGFHVAASLFREIPFGKNSFSTGELARLAAFGDQLWDKLQAHRFVSLNAGKQTIGFRPLSCHGERDHIDALLADVAGLDVDFTSELRQFVHKNTVVDDSDDRRNHVKRYFDGGTNE